ncbi:hypothetical protein BG004_004898 [Podila humilis]|nr:hypothetical protein BG004_004898 [Podila humilis]
MFACSVTPEMQPGRTWNETTTIAPVSRQTGSSGPSASWTSPASRQSEDHSKAAASNLSAPIHSLSTTITQATARPMSHDATPKHNSCENDDQDGQETVETVPLRQLRSSRSDSSIASDLSASSNTTNQTFLSTLSFSTTTGLHIRTQTHEDILRSPASKQSLTGSARRFDYEKHSQDEYDEDELVDIDALDVAILTPRGNKSIPLERHQTFTTRHAQQLPHVLDAGAESSGSSSSSSHRSGARKSHTKSSSQLSSGVVTIKGGRTQNSEGFDSEGERPSSRDSSLAPSSDIPRLQLHLQPDEGMQYTSPDYRKSMVASIHSDDIAMDFSNAASPISGRGSYYPKVDTKQYGSLLQDAASIIEQQHQGRVTSGRSNVSGVASPTHVTHESGYEAIAAMMPSRPSSGRTIHRTVQEVQATTPESPSMSTAVAPPEPPASQQLSDSGGQAPHVTPSTTSISEVSQNTPGTSSNRSTLTRSRSRRFSAHGNQFSSQTSLTSLNESPKISSRSRQRRTTQDGFGDREYPDSSGGTAVSDGNKPKSDGSLHTHTLQRFSTAHPLLYEEYSVSSSSNIVSHNGASNHTLAPLPITPSSNGLHYQHNNVPRHHHDYRPGVVFEYYEGEWDWLPNFDEMRPQHVGIVGNFMIDDSTERELFRPKFPLMMRRTGAGGAYGVGSVTRHEAGNYAVRFTTNFDITQEGVYSFWLSSNDGSVLYIANTLVVENDGMHYSTEVEGRILLTAGKHLMTVEFFHKNGKMLEGFRSTGPSLVVSYRAPGPVWSFGLGAGPKQTTKSSNFFYDHGDMRIVNLLNEYGVFADELTTLEGSGGRHAPPANRANEVGKVAGKAALWNKGGDGKVNAVDEDSASKHQSWRQGSQGTRPTRHRVMSGDMAQLQPSARELHVQMENAKTTIKDLEQIISEQAESHRNKMNQLYEILQDTQDQVDRLVNGLQKATLFENPRTTIVQNCHRNAMDGINNGSGKGTTPPTNLPSALINRGHFSRLNDLYNSSGSNWRSTVVSVYVDAEEEHQDREHEDGSESEMEDQAGEGQTSSGDDILAKHLADLEKLKQYKLQRMRKED